MPRNMREPCSQEVTSTSEWCVCCQPSIVAGHQPPLLRLAVTRSKWKLPTSLAWFIWTSRWYCSQPTWMGTIQIWSTLAVVCFFLVLFFWLFFLFFCVCFTDYALIPLIQVAKHGEITNCRLHKAGSTRDMLLWWRMCRMMVGITRLCGLVHQRFPLHHDGHHTYVLTASGRSARTPGIGWM